jgi:cytoskeleton protein RodZ
MIETSVMTSAPLPESPPDEFYTDLSVGEILRRARLQKKMSIDDAERHLRIRAEQLEALERSDFESLPGQTYVIGFVRTYAEFLGLDGGRVVHLLKRQSSGLGTPQSLNVHVLPADSRLPSVPATVIAVGVLFCIVVLWAVYQGMRIGPVPRDPVQGQTIGGFLEADSVSSPVIAAPVPSKGSVPTAVPVVVPGLVIRILDATWIELRRPDGKVAEARVFSKGESLSVDNVVDEFGNPHVLTMGNAAAVELVLDGVVLPKLGGVNEVRRNISLHPRVLKTLAASAE